MNNRPMHLAYKTARKIAIGLVGGTVVCVGVALLVLPGPAFVVIPTGLAILAIEFTWARRWLHIVRERADGLVNRSRKKSEKSGDPPD